MSKSVDNSGSSVLGTAVTGSISAAGASTDGDSLFAGDILCFPEKTKTETCKVIAWLACNTGYNNPNSHVIFLLNRCHPIQEQPTRYSCCQNQYIVRQTVDKNRGSYQLLNTLFKKHFSCFSRVT